MIENQNATSLCPSSPTNARVAFGEALRPSARVAHQRSDSGMLFFGRRRPACEANISSIREPEVGWLVLSVARLVDRP